MGRAAGQLKSSLTTDVARGEYRALARTTFAAYAAEWLVTYTGRTARGVRPETLAEYRRSMERDAIPFFGQMRLSEIEPRDVKLFAAAVATRRVKVKGGGSRPVSVTTVRLALAPFRACMATAVEEGLIRHNPTIGVRVARSAVFVDDDQSRIRALSEDELARLLTSVDPQWRVLIEFLAHTGLRISEALGLRWDDVDLGARRVQVRRRLYKGSLAQPKTRFGRRDVPLTEGMARSLWALRKDHAGRDRDPVFTNTLGEACDRTNLFARVMKPAARAADVPWAGFHTLRHTCATTLFRRGLNAKQVQVWMGHHSPAFTLERYVHLLADDLPDPGFLDALTAPRTQGGTRPTEMSRDAESAGGAETA